MLRQRSLLEFSSANSRLWHGSKLQFRQIFNYVGILRSGSLWMKVWITDDVILSTFLFTLFVQITCKLNLPVVNWSCYWNKNLFHSELTRMEICQLTAFILENVWNVLIKKPYVLFVLSKTNEYHQFQFEYFRKHNQRFLFIFPQSDRGNYSQTATQCAAWVSCSWNLIGHLQQCFGTCYSKVVSSTQISVQETRRFSLSLRLCSANCPILFSASNSFNASRAHLHNYCYTRTRWIWNKGHYGTSPWPSPQIC